MSDISLLASAGTVAAGLIGTIAAHIPVRGRSLRARLTGRTHCLTVGISLIADRPRQLPALQAMSLFDDLGDLVTESSLHISRRLARPSEWERSYLSDIDSAGAADSGRGALLLSVNPTAAVTAKAFVEVGADETWQHIIALVQHHFRTSGFGTRVLSPTEVALAAATPAVWTVKRNTSKAALLPAFRMQVSQPGGIDTTTIPAAPQLVLGLDSAGEVVGLRPQIDGMARILAPQEVQIKLAEALLANGWTVGIRVSRPHKWRDFIHAAAGRAWFFDDSPRPCDVVFVDVGAPHPTGPCVWEISSDAPQNYTGGLDDQVVDTQCPFTLVVQGALWQLHTAAGPDSTVTGVLPLPSLTEDVRQIRRT